MAESRGGSRRSVSSRRSLRENQRPRAVALATLLDDLDITEADFAQERADVLETQPFRAARHSGERVGGSGLDEGPVPERTTANRVLAPGVGIRRVVRIEEDRLANAEFTKYGNDGEFARPSPTELFVLG